VSAIRTVAYKSTSATPGLGAIEGASLGRGVAPESREQPAEPGEQGPISWSQCRARNAAAQHRDLVPEDDDLNGEFALLRTEGSGQLENSDERKIEEEQRHSPVSTRPSRRRKYSWVCSDEVFGTDRKEQAVSE
jgi:hypothetical protein